MKALSQKDKAGKIEHLLTRNVEDVMERSHLESALRGSRALRVKLGIDPTGAKIHIGRAVVLWKLREYQDLGHKIVLIIGDYTALIGDPSDKLAKRPMLTKEDVSRNARTYLAQIGKILNLKKTEVRWNSEWLSKLKFLDVLKLTDLFSVQQMIERRNFADRLERQEEIGLRELMYPLMQGYDSVAVKSDVELGGTDQLFNLLAGRKVQEHYGQKPQDVMLTSMIFGLDGRKMSTSWGNVVNITDAAGDMFGKLMSMRDEMIVPYFRSLTDLGEDEIAMQEQDLAKGANPKTVKEKLAFAVTARYHGEDAAGKALDQWEKVFSKKSASDTDLAVLPVARGATLLDIVMGAAVVSSKSEARRLIEQGGVSIDGARKDDPKEKPDLGGGEILRVGKKSFFRIEV